MKYSFSEIKERVQAVRKEYSVVQNFFHNQTGWIGKNFNSYLFLDCVISYAEDWIKAIENVDMITIGGCGETVEELLDSHFGVALSNAINPEENFGDSNEEHNEILIRFLLDIGTPGVVSWTSGLDVLSTNVFVDCVKTGNISIFRELIENTEVISAEHYFEILQAWKDDEIDYTQLSGLPASYIKDLGDSDAMFKKKVVEAYISLIDKVENKRMLLDLIKENVGLVLRDDLKKALHKIELEMTLSTKEVKRKIKKI